jgi:hypothetical protein
MHGIVERPWLGQRRRRGALRDGDQLPAGK